MTARLNASFNSQSVLTLTRLAAQLADRFERLGLDERFKLF